jgi:exo-1,4-beta-D-glucosaminidase
MQRALLLLAGVSLASAAIAAEPVRNTLTLQENWAIQSSAKAGAKGDVISTPSFPAEGWVRTSVPTTVVSALVANKVYPDPYFGMNLRSIPGTDYKVSTNFSNVAMPAASPFNKSWWYRTSFDVPAEWSGRTLWLKFEAINYRANVWLNGRQIATSTKMAGSWRIFEFDVTGAVKTGQANALAVEVFPPAPNDLAVTFVDWNPLPADKDMGLWRPVRLIATGPVAVRYPQVITRLNLPSTDQASLTVTAELQNASAKAVAGTLKGTIGELEFSQPVELAAHESRVVTFAPDKFAQLKIANPKLWWPAQVGEQNLYPLHIAFEADGQVSDAADIRFGIREVTSRIDEKKHIVFSINGQNILIRSAGYTFDMLLRTSPERELAELKYVRDMNLNSVRLEGKIEDEHFLNLTDEMGILVFAGWCCCDHWEQWKHWTPENHVVAVESLKDQVRHMRWHASLANWMNGSDGPPPPAVEKAYLQVLKDYNWPNPVESSATQKPTTVTGESGVKMLGPYEYVAPSYWLLDKKLGGAHGFATEVGPGPAVPPIESLRRMLPKEHLWPIDEYWNYHCGGGAFKDMHVFTDALNARYGQAKGVEDYAQKAQVQAYEGHRAMFEAFGRNKYTSTGVVQWMLNNAWPSNIWHLYDWYLRPGGSYFGAKKANEPLHVQYSYDDQSVVVVNSFYRAFPGLKVAAKIYNLDLTEKFSKEETLDAGPDSSGRVFTLPKPEGLSGTYFVRLTLTDAAGKVVSSNFYWLSLKPEELDWDKSTWYHTPTKSYADMTALETLPKVDLVYAAQSELGGTEGKTRVTIENPSKTLAFFVRLKVNKSSDGEEILPVVWEDNYFSLLPGEKREITAAYRASDLGDAKPVVEVGGWNVNRKGE